MKIKLPELGEGVNSAKVVDILVSEGDTVGKEDEVIEVETDKAVAGVPAEAEGKVSKILVQKGDDVSVGDVLVELEEDETESEESDESKDEKDEKDDQEDKDDEDNEKKASDTDDSDEDNKEEETERRAEAEEDKESGEDKEPEDDDAKSGKPGPAARPELRKMARELGIDLSRVRGSGPGGRIDAADIRSYVAKLQKKVFEDSQVAFPAEDLSKFGPIHSEELPAIRKTISNRLLERWRSSPLVTQFGEANLETVLKLKDKHSQAFQDKDTRLTLTCFFIHALVPLLKKHPDLNAALDLEAGKIIYRDYLNFGIAVATEKGLMVPVIREVDELSVLELAKTLESLSEKARGGKLGPKDMEGASFYISNQGAIGGGHFTPLLSGTESAILGIGKGRQQVVESEDGFKSILTVPLSLSYDHRMIDGAQAAEFMRELEQSLEEFDESVFKSLTSS